METNYDRRVLARSDDSPSRAQEDRTVALHRPLGYATRYFGQCAKGPVYRRRVAENRCYVRLELDQVGALGIALGVLTPNPIREVVFGSQPPLSSSRFCLLHTFVVRPASQAWR